MPNPTASEASRTPRRGKITPEDSAQAAKWRAQGLRWGEIGQRLGCSASGIAARVRRDRAMGREHTAPREPRLVAEFHIPGEPVSKSRARFTKRGSKTFAYTPQKTLDGERQIAAAYLEVAKRRETDPDAAFAVEAEFYCGTRQRRDVDNMVKLVLDGLNGIAFPDDNQVIRISASKMFTGKADARTVVRLYRDGDMNPPTAPCLYCGRPFLTYESWQDSGKRYCGRECVNAHRIEKKRRTCKRCGVEFQAWGETSETKYCSTDCLYESGRADYTCSVCGAEFRDQTHLGARRKNYFCGDECREEFHRRANEFCRHGHPWSENTAYRKNGAKFCRACKRVRDREHAARLKGRSVRREAEAKKSADPGSDEPGVTITITEETER